MSADEIKIAWKTAFLIVIAGICYRLGETQTAKYLLIATACSWIWIIKEGLQRRYFEWKSEKDKIAS